MDDTIRCDVRVGAKNTYGGIRFGVQSTQKPFPRYLLRVDTGASPGVEFGKITDSVQSHEVADANKLSSKFPDAGVEPVAGTTYTAEIRWNGDGTMPLSITD